MHVGSMPKVPRERAAAVSENGDSAVGAVLVVVVVLVNVSKISNSGSSEFRELRPAIRSRVASSFHFHVDRSVSVSHLFSRNSSHTLTVERKSE